MAFFECEFPRGIGYHRLGSPSGWSTNVNEGFSGQEARNKNWSSSRGKWSINLITPSDTQRGALSRLNYIQSLIAFHSVVAGRGDAFRLFDHLDNSAVGQALATVNGQVQLVKNYVIGGRTFQRVITKPITSSVVDWQGNALPNTVVLHSGGGPVTVDYTTGIVTGQTAGTLVDFQFHYAARFDNDELPLRVEPSNTHSGNPVISLDAFNLIEVFPPNY